LSVSCVSYPACDTREALGAAVAAGIVHQDLKPGNVMVTDRGDVKVLDFGVAKLLPSETAKEEPQTITSGGTQLGVVLGTPEYMSPEQASGASVDHRPDILSFGVLLFRMLTGARPFARTNWIASLHSLISDPAPRVSSMRPGLPRHLDEVVARLLAKDREARYQSFAEVIKALEGSDSEWHRRPEVSGEGRTALGSTVRTGVAPAAVLLAAAVAWWVGFLPAPAQTEGGTPAVSVRPDEPLLATASDHVREGERYLARYDREGYVDKALDLFQKALERQPDHAPAYAGLAKAYWRKHGGRAIQCGASTPSTTRVKRWTRIRCWPAGTPCSVWPC
jgi:hypothetical protein